MADFAMLYGIKLYFSTRFPTVTIFITTMKFCFCKKFFLCDKAGYYGI